MERMSVELLRWVFGTALIFGPPVAWLILLNLGDRRVTRLSSLVHRPLALPSLRGRFAVRIRCPLLSRRSLVVVEVLAGTPHEIWDIFTCLAHALPPRVTLRVNDVGDCQRSRPLTLQTVTRRWPPRHPYSTLAGV
jgi:hypothetical protein